MQAVQLNVTDRAARLVYHSRHRAATALAVGLALVFGYHAIFGHNGITAYAEKRSEDRALTLEIEKLQQENALLKDHVDHLQNDPDAIEREARERLHYTRPGEVIYTLGDRAPETPGAGAPVHAASTGDGPAPGSAASGAVRR